MLKNIKNWLTSYKTNRCNPALFNLLTASSNMKHRWQVLLR